MDVSAAIDRIDAATLAPVVRRALGRPTAEIVDWRREPLHYHPVAVLSRENHKFAGTAFSQGENLPWTVVLKFYHPPTAERPAAYADSGWDDPTRRQYWKREPLAYQSGLLAELPAGGIVTPRCFAVEEVSEGCIFLWLEYVEEADDPSWSLARYGLAARHLGVFGGAYVAGRALPTFPWLSESIPRAHSGRYGPPAVELARTPGIWENQLVQRAFPRPVKERLLRAFGERERFLGALDRLPRTFAHQDAFRGNLLSRRRHGQSAETVAIDWAFAGITAIGEDLGQLVAGSLLAFRLPRLELDPIELDTVAWDAYRAGLREAGWRGDERLARLGATLYGWLRWGILVAEVLRAADEANHSDIERFHQKPIADVVAECARVVQLVLDWADEAMDLIDTLSLG